MKTAHLLLLIPLFVSLSSFGETVKLAIGDWAPYTSSSDANGKISEKIVEAAFAEEGVTVKLDYFPWARSYKLVVEGKYDGTFPWYSTDQKRKETLYSEQPVIEDKEVFFKLKSSGFKWDTLPDLKTYKVGAIIGYSHVDRFKAASVRFSGVKNEKLNFQKLISKRIDTFPASELVGYYLLKQQFSKQEAAMITHDSKPLSNSGMYVLFSRTKSGSKGFYEKFNKGMKAIKENGTLEKILKKY